LDRVKVTSACTMPVGLPACPTLWLYLKQYGNMPIWNSCNVDIPRSLNSRDSFLKTKFENRPPTGCRVGPVLSWSTITFELHAEITEEIDLEKCNFRQFSELSTRRDLDFRSGQGHISIHNRCRATRMPNRVTVSSRSTEIWPFEFREISTFREVWTHVIALIEESSKIGLWQAVEHVPYYHHQPSVLSSIRKWRRR